MTEETQIIPMQEIEQALVKENVTRQVLNDIKQYRNLDIKDLNDKEGYKLVREARIECKNTRVLAEKICKKGRERANLVSKAWIAKEKEVVGEIEETELYLKEKEDWFDAEKHRLEVEKKEAEMKVIQDKIDALHSFGDMIDYFGAKKLSEEEYQHRLSEARTTYEDKLLEEQAEKERIERIAKEQEEVRLKQEAEAKKLSEEREAIEREKRAIEEAKQKSLAEKERLEELEEARKEGEIKAKKEAEEKARLEAIEKQKEEDYRKAEEARLKALQPDKNKFAEVVNILSHLIIEVTPTSKEGKEQYSKAIIHLNEAIKILNQ